ncbi:MAG: hypothetical protein ACXAE3_17285 [Candidatus Kariarchaeaceae archaeon]|jgi:hypothetical protein
MSQFKGDSSDSFSFLAVLGHLLIALGVIATCVGLFYNMFGGDMELVGLIVGAGGGGVVAGIGLSFINVLFN